MSAADIQAELGNETAWLRFGPEYVCGTKRIVYGWTGEKESMVNATVTKNCHNRHCMIYYTQLPLWFLVMIAFAIGRTISKIIKFNDFPVGLSWECYSVTARYQAAAQEEKQMGHPKRGYNPCLLAIASCIQSCMCFGKKPEQKIDAEESAPLRVGNTKA